MTVPQSPQKLFKCPDTHCDYTNVINDYVIKHMKTVHNMQLESEENEAEKSESDNLDLYTHGSIKKFKGIFFTESIIKSSNFGEMNGYQ